MAPILYALGSNGSGQLALGHRDDVNRPTACLFHEPLPQGRRPVTIAAGGNHTLLLCNDGTVYTAGKNADGGYHPNPLLHSPNLKNNTDVQDSEHLTTFHRITFLTPPTTPAEALPPRSVNINHISATWSASFFATSTALYTAGTGLKAELGLGPTTTSTPAYPIKLPDFPPRDAEIVHLASGVHHTIVVLSTGDVYGWGMARHGELGEPRVPTVATPRRIGGIGFRARRAVAGLGWTYVVATAQDGSSEGIGGFEHVLLGSNKHGLRTALPPAHELSNYVSVTSSWSSVYVLLKSGSVIGLGRSSSVKDPSAVPRDLPRTGALVAGSEHVLAKGAEDGEVRAWGWGEHGNCGYGWGDVGSTGGKVSPEQVGNENDLQEEKEDILRAEKCWNKLQIPNHYQNDTTNVNLIPIGAGCATSWLLLDDVVET